MCTVGAACTSFAPGHALHPVPSGLASATASEWLDAIVVRSRPDGTIVLAMWAGGEVVEVWHAGHAAGVSPWGTPVSYHPRYHVLAVGAERFNVLALS